MDLVVNAFLHASRSAMRRGDLTPGSYGDFEWVCRIIISGLGRHTFQTSGDMTGDTNAVKYMMGHALPGLDAAALGNACPVAVIGRSGTKAPWQPSACRGSWDECPLDK